MRGSDVARVALGIPVVAVVTRFALFNRWLDRWIEKSAEKQFYRGRMHRAQLEAELIREMIDTKESTHVEY